MFKDILKKIATEYRSEKTYFGGDVETDIVAAPRRTVVDGQKFVYYPRVSSLPGYERALYDLGIIEALPAPAEGEVRIHADRAQAILDLDQLRNELMAAREARHMSDLALEKALEQRDRARAECLYLEILARQSPLWDVGEDADLLAALADEPEEVKP
jgi:hypothetical protein